MTTRLAARPGGTRVERFRQSERRRGLIAKIHVARKQLNMSEESYRALLSRMSENRVDSSGLMNDFELEKTLKEMERLGFKPAAPKPRTDRLSDTSPEGKLIRAIWLQLHAIGAVRDPSERAMLAYVKRIGNVEAIRWLDDSKIEAVVETMKKWAVRVFPKALESLWRELAAKGIFPEFSSENLDHYIAVNALGKKHLTYENLLSCWEKLQSLNGAKNG